MSNPEDLARRMLDATDRQDWAAREAMLSPDCDFVTPAGALRGPAATTAYSAPFAVAFPGSRHEIDLLAGVGHLVVAEGMWTAIQKGQLITPRGPIPATGKSVALPFVVTMRASGDLIASMHVYFDQMAFLAQLGLLPQFQPA